MIPGETIATGASNKCAVCGAKLELKVLKMGAFDCNVASLGHSTDSLEESIISDWIEQAKENA